MDTIPIVCNMNAFDAEQQIRYRALVETLRGRVQSVQEIEEGFVFLFPSESAICLAAMEFATLERRCCSFLTFTLELAPQGGALTLSLRGPEGAKEVLADFVQTIQPAA